MNRREFGVAALSAALYPLHDPAQMPAPQNLLLSFTGLGRKVPASFTGLSYELAQLTDPGFFSTANKGLVSLLAALSPGGLLRIGGNTSEFCWLEATPETGPIALRQPKGDLQQNWMPHRLFAIPTEAVVQLKGFLDATGWRCIFGLNYGNSSPKRAAAEAEFVSRALGDKLAFFQIGNEPDFYRDSNNGVRPAGWGFDDYVREWISYADAITARVPSAVFGGPDSGASSDWVVRFGQEVAPQLGQRLVALSGHYYAEGPPNDPRVTAARLLAGNSAVATSTESIVSVADQNGLVYHMSEGNSCYRGGKPGMSDAFAASLWAADYLLELASLGCGGVNLHGGSSSFLSAGLGDHNPGLEALGGSKADKLNGFYTPIATEPGEPIAARPVYYGMLFAQQFAKATVRAVPTSNFLVRAYTGERDDERFLAVVNKSAEPQSFVLSTKQRLLHASRFVLTAPSVDATSGVTFGGATVDSGGAWKPVSEKLSVRKGKASVLVSQYSASLVFLK